MHRALIILLLLLHLAAGSTAGLAQESARQSAVEQQDVRLARIAEQLLGGNAALCTSLMPLTGLILHSVDQYRDGEVRAQFRDGNIAIAAIVPHSPAERAGLRRGEALVAIGDVSLDALPAPESGNLREAAFDILAAQPTDAPVALRLRTDGVERTVMLPAPAGCRSLVEILVSDGPRARSDGRVIQIQFDFARELSDEQLAVVLAHELAHTVLEHRRRKQAAGIDNGALAEVGRNQRANREAEVEADRLSIHLLANAGFDPLSVPAFWRSDIGQRLGGGIFNSFVYPSNEARAVLVDEEIALYLPQRRGPSWPGHLLELRERGFGSD
ncbi:M48 family metallopeptidase [Erythrobacter sp. EC-HK427]|uniref:M48 family metallopeptidase n=1 Tax=Erythrobacter sp. EC-HK427 TaxID=2038396 RepID=UPI001254424F|nr:M48 family metallopeptidase [Erythrobacter sp. EC-HK427]VVT15310.1 conserved exported hypothetical protein [Erythrobacter sp. EC-HK427]